VTGVIAKKLGMKAAVTKNHNVLDLGIASTLF